MTQIRTTVSVEITDTRGEVFEVKRTLVRDSTDNPRFWAEYSANEIEAAKTTLFSQIVHQYEDTP